ncbi:MAG: hypothetical protein JWN63_1342 [Candidatus Acidoferrum typicum]|jgi:hypothetical protein|nr:hypothetical protein [Candidatus Acidoferrum typicum]
MGALGRKTVRKVSFGSPTADPAAVLEQSHTQGREDDW